MAAFETVIGLEVHLQLNTRTKMFCRCRNHFGDAPNTNVCPVCLGMPGSLPVINETAVRYARQAGLMLNCAVAQFSKFDRKNYFYPDLPKAYQISQYDLPLCGKGHIDVEMDGGTRRFGITRVHLEEDAGKLVHDGHGGGSLVDLNRSGTPLLEIVSEPDMRSPDEAHAYLVTLKQLMSYLDISDCNMEEGSLRCDANVSVRPAGQAAFGTKVEIKNMNSFKAVQKALAYEVRRQIAAIEAGQTIVQETRLFDANSEKTVSMRTKEQAHDYRYFPDPDLVPMTFTAAEIETLKAQLPERPAVRRERFAAQYGISAYDAGVLTAEKPLADYFEAAISAGMSGKAAANWIINNLMAELNAAHRSITDCPITPAHLAELGALIEGNVISGNIGKQIFPEMFNTGKAPEEIVNEKGLVQITDSAEIDAWVNEAIARNPDVIESLKAGKGKAAGKLVGAVMQMSKGKANPALVNERIRHILIETHGLDA
ncbi:Asp-tRNA(Asn)/Glu-tRNA(Gln) amidotransferase subunit GatB [bacterium]|nr:Asp-tRNA(Asn)/Glu-tRNA(Gln) amidotransferase subunit GatB [bacterium]